MKWLDDLPLPALIVAAIFMGGSPFRPEPHLWEKLKMLEAGTLTGSMDILDLLLHAVPVIVLVLKLVRIRQLAESA